jgi:hypothetical protein
MKVKDDALKLLRQFLGMSSALTLNVAGPRASRASGIQVKANVERIKTACSFFLY